MAAKYSESFARQQQGRSTWFEETIIGESDPAKLAYMQSLPG